MKDWKSELMSVVMNEECCLLQCILTLRQKHMEIQIRNLIQTHTQ